MYKHFLTSVLLVFFMLSCSKSSPFEGKMRESVQTSLSWRNDTTGIWETAGWWNSANVLTATIRYGAVTKDPAIPSVIEDVFEKARHYQVGVDSTGTPRYCDNFINDYYDDEGWWALAWIEASKLTGEKKYLDMAEIIFDDMTKDDCTPNRNAHYTYNQGVASAVLAEMYLQTNDKSYLELAEKIADATITTQLVTDEGILREMKPEIDDSNDGVQFKGIFIRHLAFLYDLTKKPAYKDFILKNAESIITRDYDPASKSFGCYWYGPFHKESSAANACALECVIEAYELTK